MVPSPSQALHSNCTSCNACHAAAPKPRLAPVLVEVPALVDLKLDGKATKLEGLLQLSPWYKSLQQQQQRQQAAAAEAAAQAEQAAAPATAAKGGQAGAKKKGKPKDPQVLEFTVKAAAALTGADPPVMPAGLLEWAIEVRCCLRCSRCLLTEPEGPYLRHCARCGAGPNQQGPY